MTCKETNKIIDTFLRTMRNCEYYESHNMTKSLINEIGCLRGIAYCMEELGLCPHNYPDFRKYISIQQALLQAEKETHFRG